MLLVFGSAHAQTLEDLQNYQDLYWDYRDRFAEQYVVVDWNGDGIGDWNNQHENKFDKAGYSIPVGGYISHSNCHEPGMFWQYGSFETFDGECLHQPEELRGPGKGVVAYGDGTYHLGHYIAVLSTEYALLSKGSNQEAINKTIEELYLALQAYKRLDKTANLLGENYMTSNGKEWEADESGHSGYCLRSDAPASLWQDFNHPDINCVVDRYASCNDFNPEYSVLSHDQIIGLMYGFTLMKKLVPESVQHHGVSLISEMQTIADGLVKGLAEDGWLLRAPCLNCNPTGIDLVCETDGNGLNHLGCNAWFTGYAIDKSLQYINGNSYLENDEGSLTLLWVLHSLAFQLGFLNYDFVNYMLYISIATSGNDFFSSGYAASCFVKGRHIFPLTRDILYDNYTLNGGQKNIVKQKLEALFAVAPATGPCKPDPGYDCDADFEWRSANRWWHAIGGGNLSPARWNGLDYMLAYNLYHLYYWGNENYDPNARVTGAKISFVENTDHSELTAYPNPVTNQVNLKTAATAANDRVEVQVVNANGIVVLNQAFSLSDLNQTPISVMDLPSGIYFIHLKLANGKTLTQKVVKQ